MLLRLFCLNQGDIGSVLAVGADEGLTDVMSISTVTGPSDPCPIVICLIITNR